MEQRGDDWRSERARASIHRTDNRVQNVWEGVPSSTPKVAKREDITGKSDYHARDENSADQLICWSVERVTSYLSLVHHVEALVHLEGVSRCAASCRSGSVSYPGGFCLRETFCDLYKGRVSA